MEINSFSSLLNNVLMPQVGFTVFAIILQMQVSYVSHLHERSENEFF